MASATGSPIAPSVHIPIRTRETGDHRADTVRKAEWLDEGRMPELVYEDSASVVALRRSCGIVCCQAAPGDFWCNKLASSTSYAPP